MNNCVFVLEDNEAIREIIEILLETKGFNVKSFANATEFYEGINNGDPPALIIMDVMLPDGNGIEICKMLKADSKKQMIPVLLMSAHASKDEAMNANAEGFIAKPFDINLFMDQVSGQVA